LAKPFRRFVAVAAVWMFLVILQTGASTMAATYSRSAQLTPVRMSQSELLSIVGRIRAFVDFANRDIEPERRSEKFELEGGPSKLVLTGRFGASELAGAPEFATRVLYWYRVNRDAPISDVSIWLSDYSRELAVEGTSREQVEALVSLMSQDLGARSIPFGGRMQRLFGGLVLMLVGWGVVALSNLARNRRIQIALMVSGLLLVLCTIVLPWSDWLPGTAVYPGDASWLVRNSPFLSLLGVVLTLVTFVLSTAYSAYKGKRG